MISTRLGNPSCLHFVMTLAGILYFFPSKSLVIFILFLLLDMQDYVPLSSSVECSYHIHIVGLAMPACLLNTHCVDVT